MEKQTHTFECEVSKPDKPATWFKDNQPLESSDRIEIRTEAGKHFLTIKECVLDDQAKYTIKFDTAESTAKLNVEGTTILLSSCKNNISDD